MRKTHAALLALFVSACSFTTIADRYGNEYGDWYNPGGNFQWQLNLCEQQMDTRSVPAPERKLAMRCCMRDHGVPVDVESGCAAASG
jgi:hypothetical protein